MAVRSLVGLLPHFSILSFFLSGSTNLSKSVLFPILIDEQRSHVPFGVKTIFIIHEIRKLFHHSKLWGHISGWWFNKIIYLNV